jgi:hypothetical protein
MMQTIQLIASFLIRDVRDLFKAHGTLVDNRFLDTPRTAVERAGVGQDVATQVLIDVASAWRGRLVQMEQITEVVKLRIREAFGE